VLYSSAVTAIGDAKAAEKQYGKGSPEAIIAWETVEEIASSDHPSMARGLDEECKMEDSALCEEYAKNVAELQKILGEQSSQLKRVKDLTANVRAVQIKGLPTPTNNVDSAALKAAIAEAKAATKNHGSSSREAAVAWDTVEEISAADNSQTTIPALLDDECLLEAVEACDALSELERVIVVSVCQ